LRRQPGGPAGRRKKLAAFSCGSEMLQRTGAMKLELATIRVTYCSKTAKTHVVDFASELLPLPKAYD
jgi:hypothetical protein